MPLALRAVLPFTFFSLFQYTIVSRSYVLIPPLLYAVAAIYAKRDVHLIRFAALLTAMMQVSLHGACLAAALGILTLLDFWRGRLDRSRVTFASAVIALSLLAASAVALIVVLWPRSDLVTGSIVDLSFSPMKMLRIAGIVATENLVGHSELFLANAAASALGIALLVWFRQRGVILEFLVLFASLLPVSSMYFARWHEGLFFWATVFVLLIPPETVAVRSPIAIAGWCAVGVMIFMQCLWSAESLVYDARMNFTGSRDAARFIASHGIDRTRLFGAGVRCLELQPYFPANVFANYRTTDGGAYWNWTRANPWPFPLIQPDLPSMARWLQAQLDGRPDYFITAAGFRADHLYAATLRQRPDYRELQQFHGGFFWKDRVVERIDFSLFERIQRR